MSDSAANSQEYLRSTGTLSEPTPVPRSLEARVRDLAIELNGLAARAPYAVGIPFEEGAIRGDAYAHAARLVAALLEGESIAPETSGEYRIYLDGDKWCAVPPGFIDLQVSQSGFGVTPVDALERLMLVVVPKIAPAPDCCPSCNTETYAECPSCRDQLHFECDIWRCRCGFSVAPGAPLAPATKGGER